MPFFFPDPVFGWYFFAVLMIFLVVAAYIDSRTLRIPKWLTISLLALGVVFNVVRGAGLGAVLAAHGSGSGVYFLRPGTWPGALDGLLFALLGFAVSFGLVYILWVLGSMGGGDVKLFAALGAWVGPWHALYIFMATGPVIVVLLLGQAVWKMFNRKSGKAFFGMRDPSGARAAREAKEAAVRKAARKGLRPRQRVTAYGLPVAISTALVLLLCHARDLGWLTLFRAPPVAAAAGGAGPR